jgi:hypothetical protein
MTRPDERRFVLFERGHVRDQIILAHFRNQMRVKINPDTGAVFTEDEILRLTQPGSRFYIEADAIDIYGQAVQSRNSFFVDQIFPHSASSAMLQGQHGPLWLPDGYLAASGGSGEVTAKADVGVIFVGSSTIPDPGATWGRDPNGKRYQVLTTRVTPGSGVITDLVLVGVDGGDDTNIAIGTEISWHNPPIGSQPTATVSIAFEGGLEQETDSEFADRLEDRIRHKPASGNSAHFRAWARQASNLVETAFVFAAAPRAGSVLVCITKKRGSSLGPLGRFPTVALKTIATAYLVPPNSPVVPSWPSVVVTGPQSQPSDLAITLGLRRGANGGWASPRPWPSSTTSFPKAAITSVVSQTVIRVGTDVAPVGTLPLTGGNAPQLMVWNKSTSRFEKLVVASVAFSSTNVYEITLSSAASFTLTSGMVISPYTDRLVVIAESIETYFDALGPGEVVNLTSDVRATRAFRYPRASEEYPQRAGAAIITTILDSLGGAAGDGDVSEITETVPDLPTDMTDGPNMLTLGDVGVYDLE